MILTCSPVLYDTYLPFIYLLVAFLYFSFCLLLLVACCLLHVACCLLLVACCLLLVGCCLLLPPPRVNFVDPRGNGLGLHNIATWILLCAEGYASLLHRQTHVVKREVTHVREVTTPPTKHCTPTQHDVGWCAPLLYCQTWSKHASNNNIVLQRDACVGWCARRKGTRRRRLREHSVSFTVSEKSGRSYRLLLLSVIV